MARQLTAFATAWRQQQAVSYDWLVESIALDIHWSYRTTTAGGFAWQHRLHAISAIEESIPPGGGLASTQTVTISIYESTTGKSLRAIWDDVGRLEGADLTVSLLPAGEDYDDRIRRFTGTIDHVSWATGARGGIGTLIAVSRELHRDLQLPQTVLTTDTYPNLPDPWQGAVLPLIYGSSSHLRVAPLLMIDSVSLRYLVADHPMGLMHALHSPLLPQRLSTLPLAGNATVDAAAASLVLIQPVTENRYTVGGVTRSISQDVSVNFPNSLIDNNAATESLIGTHTLNGEGDGWGRLAVLHTWPDPDLANTAIITLFTQRRNPAAATTVSADLIVRSVHPVTLAIQRDNLFRDGPYRHSSNPRTRAVTIAPLTIVSPAGLEVEIQATNEGGAGVLGIDYWSISELTVDLFFQADSLFYPLLLCDPWVGRIDHDGTLTSAPGLSIIQGVAVIESVLTHLLGLPTHTASFAIVSSTLLTYAPSMYRFDFGLGSGGWYRPQMSAVELLDTLAQQALCYLFPRGDGTVAIARCRGTLTSQLTLTPANMDHVEVELSRLELVHSTYEVRYAWSVQLGRFTKVALANPGACNHPTAAGDLLLKCADSQDRYGPQTPLIREAYAIQDDATAFTYLAHLVNYFWTQQTLVTCETSFVGVHLEVADFVTISHPELPLRASGGLFEIVRLSTIPEVPQARPWPIQLVGLITTLPTFDYFAIKDQTGVIWYWWVDRGGNLDWGLAPPTIATRVARDLALSPIPSWLQFGSATVGTPGLWDLFLWWALPTAPPPPVGALRYVFPIPLTGAPDLSDVLPSVGTGYPESPTLRGQGTGRWQIAVTEYDAIDIVHL